jgi:hypothetical protein
MNDLIEKLLRSKATSQSKSYLIGIERGRLWAEDTADYLNLREWHEYQGEDSMAVMLPKEEELHYHVLKSETGIEWNQYVRGWVSGVKEIARKHL